MSQGLAELQHVHQILWQPYCVGLLAEAYSRENQADKALAMIDEALATLDHTGESWYTVELHRLKGEVLLRLHTDRLIEAEAVFQQALAFARHQHAKALEFRAATSLARLWQSQGKRHEAHDLLSPVYGWFTEGFDTADWREAKALLDQLG